MRKLYSLLACITFIVYAIKPAEAFAGDQEEIQKPFYENLQLFVKSHNPPAQGPLGPTGATGPTGPTGPVAEANHLYNFGNAQTVNPGDSLSFSAGPGIIGGTAITQSVGTGSGGGDQFIITEAGHYLVLVSLYLNETITALEILINGTQPAGLGSWAMQGALAAIQKIVPIAASDLPAALEINTSSGTDFGTACTIDIIQLSQ